MARAYGEDLRRRVIEVIDGGLSARQAANRFAIGVATAIRWHRIWREQGTMNPGKQGKPRRSKLDPHEAFILDLIKTKKDIALHEIAALLKAEHDIKVCAPTIWYFLSARGITYKKRQAMHQNSKGQMSSHDARNGSISNLILTPNG